MINIRKEKVGCWDKIYGWLGWVFLDWMFRKFFLRRRYLYRGLKDEKGLVEGGDYFRKSKEFM